jgi:O-antigen/teichoic acid export membrane protein
VVASSSKITFDLSMRRNIAWTATANIIYAFFQWGVLVAIARLGSSTMLGQFALGLAITAPVVILGNLQLRNIQATDADGQFEFGHYFALRLISVVISLSICVTIIAVAGYEIQTTKIILAIAFSKTIESLSDVAYGLLQKHERLDLIATSLLMRGPASLISIAMGLWLFGDLLWAVFGLTASWIAILLIHDFPNAVRTMKHYEAKSIRPKWNSKRLFALVRLTAPSGLAAGIGSLVPNIPKYFIHGVLGENFLGIFAALAYFNAAGITVINAMGQVASPRLARYFVLGRIKDFRLLLFKFIFSAVGIGFLGVFVAVVIGKPLLSTIYGEKYAAYSKTFTLLMISAGVSYVCWFFNTSMIAMRRLFYQLVIYSLVAITTGISCYFLIPIGGLKGAAGAAIIGGVIQLAGGFTSLNPVIARKNSREQNPLDRFRNGAVKRQYCKSILQKDDLSA